MVAAIGQTITIVNKSGKIVSTSKQLVGVFNEAKSAYNERKAELKASRKAQADSKSGERDARKRLQALNIDDDASSRQSSGRSSRQSSRRRSDDGSSIKSTSSIRRKPVPERRHERPPMERGVSDSFYTNDLSPRRSSHRPSPLRHDSIVDEPRAGELTRRHTDTMRLEHHSQRSHSRRASADDVDMDLAYGELPPPLPERKYDTEVELRMKMSGLQRLLDEANCLQHSVTAIIDNLQKNPDTLAAVALTLAEISNLAAKMAPGALTTMKGAFPAIIALLASPEFAIAAGVGVGITIIAFGGYKIIKKIKAKREAEGGNLLEDGGLAYEEGRATPESEMESLREINHVERWRRGIADVESESVGSTVDGEFVTPQASRTLIQQGKLTEADLKSSEGKKKRRRKSKSEKGSVSSSSTKVKSKKEKEPSGLKMLFKKATNA